MKTAYLCGPMRGHLWFKFPVFNAAAKMLTGWRWHVMSPAQMDIDAREPWTDPARPDWADDKFQIDAQECRRLVRRDVDALLTLRPEQGDALIVLSGWQASTGGWGESSLSQWLKLPIFELGVTHSADYQTINFARSLKLIGPEDFGAKAGMRSWKEIDELVNVK